MIQRLIFLLVLIVLVQNVTAQYAFLPLQYPEYQSILNPALLPMEGPFYFDDVQLGIHQRYSNERWDPSLGKNRQTLLYYGLDMEDYPENPEKRIEMAMHINLYHEENHPSRIDAAFIGGRMRLWLFREYSKIGMPKGDQGLSLYFGYKNGIVQHRVDYSQLPLNPPTFLEGNNQFFSNLFIVDLGLSISYKADNYEVLASFSKPTDFYVGEIFYDNYGWNGDIYYTGLNMRYHRQKYNRVYKYLELKLQAGLEKGKWVNPGIGLDWGFAGSFIVGGGYSFSRESQIYEKANQGAIFFSASANIPLYNRNGNMISSHLSYRFITDADSFSGQRSHSLSFGLSLAELVQGERAETYWNKMGL
ncbi:MAG: hypothetical protein MI974_09375 [Chitinophagales bacterium]|nr:hypothetical protein [Chitinophagales bacterium]